VEGVTHGRGDVLGARADTSDESRALQVVTVPALSAVVASVFAVASFLVVFDLRIGPVVLVISQRYSRGVHLGDLLIGVPFGLVAVAAGFVALAGYQRFRHLLTR
jgi:hypothetical protein